MNSPPSSPDLHPPEYLQPSISHHHDASSSMPTSFPSAHGGSPPGLRLPPPAVSSTLLPSHAIYPKSSPLEQLQNQSRRLTIELQNLLDAQSAALIATTSGSSPTSGRSSRASNSTTSAVSPSGRYHAKSRTKKKKTANIAATRSSILTAMQELSTVKDRESSLYSNLSGERKALLKTITSHNTKTNRLRYELQKIDSSNDATTADSLRSETAAVAAEIAALRQRLNELETRHASMQTQLVELDNIVESRSVSYKSALEAVSRKTATFLHSYDQPSPDAAIETWNHEAEAFTEKAEAAARERDALEDGMQLWNTAIDTIYGFESRLRSLANDPKGQKDPATAIREIEKVVDSLNEMVNNAQEHGWRLLVVTIGAELQAYREILVLFKRRLSGNAAEGDVTVPDGTNESLQERSNVTDPLGEELVGLTINESTRLTHDYSPLDDK